MWIAVCIFAVPFIWGLDAESLLHFNIGTSPPLHTKLQAGYMAPGLHRKPTQGPDTHSVNPKAVPEPQVYALLSFRAVFPGTRGCPKSHKDTRDVVSGCPSSTPLAQPGLG